MSLAIFFWVVWLIWAITEFVGWPHSKWVLLVLTFVLGWAQFGFIIRGPG